MNLFKQRALMKNFVISQFKYCPLVWMFYSRKLNHRINRMHQTDDLSPKIIQEVFDLKEPPYSLRPQETYFVHRNVETTHCGIQSVKYLAPKIWDLVPDQIKHFGSLNRFQDFNFFFKCLSPSDCPCRLCKTKTSFI